MSHARALIGRAVVAWPLIAAALLAPSAVIEVLVRENAAATVLLLGLCATAPLAAVRDRVIPVAMTITTANVLTWMGNLPLTGAAVVAQLVVGYQLGRARPWGMSYLMVLPFVGYAVTQPRLFTVLLLTATGGAVALGATRRARDDATARVGSAHAIADTLLEHAARGERARIARELHDVVAHHISMIAVQAETARLTTPGMPAEGAKRLTAIGDTARTALTEMRRLLGVLREDAGTESTRFPQPGLAQLIELIDEARASSHTSTRLIVSGRVAALDPGVGLTAYRIVQEALTNARRHALGAAVDVELDYTVDALRLRVRDNGPGPAGDTESAGHGLLGMRERAATVGGTVWAGQAPAGGFLVEAVLPTRGAAG